jgi:hypothetical protein
VGAAFSCEYPIRALPPNAYNETIIIPSATLRFVMNPPCSKISRVGRYRNPRNAALGVA